MAGACRGRPSWSGITSAQAGEGAAAASCGCSRPTPRSARAVGAGRQAARGASLQRAPPTTPSASSSEPPRQKIGEQPKGACGAREAEGPHIMLSVVSGRNGPMFQMGREWTCQQALLRVVTLFVKHAGLPGCAIAAKLVKYRLFRNSILETGLRGSLRPDLLCFLCGVQWFLPPEPLVPGAVPPHHELPAWLEPPRGLHAQELPQLPAPQPRPPRGQRLQAAKVSHGPLCMPLTCPGGMLTSLPARN